MLQPEACYAAYTFGLKYFLRTLPNTQILPAPLDDEMLQVLLAAIMEGKRSHLEASINVRVANVTTVTGNGFYPKQGREFCDAIKLRYYWPINDLPSSCVYREIFTAQRAMICKRGGCYSAPQRTERSRNRTLEYGMQPCRDQTCPLRHLQLKSSTESVIEHQMRAWISTHTGSANTNDQNYLMSGSVTPTLAHVVT